MEYELFNIKEDIGEKENLIGKYPEIATDLRNKLKQWKQDVGAIDPAPNPDYHLIRARFRINSNGTLILDEDNKLIYRTQISINSPMLFNVPISEILEEIIGKSLTLKINDKISIGHLILNDDDEIIFHDTHEETIIGFESICKELIGREVSIRIWDKFPEELLRNNPGIFTQVEISQISELK